MTLIYFIDKYNILFVNQFGFREKHSKMHATLLITDKIQRAIEDGQFSCGSFLDFSKAFDTVDHSMLIRKLSHCGIANFGLTFFCIIEGNVFLLVALSLMTLSLLMVSLRVPSWALFYFVCMLMTSVIVASSLTFTFVQMTLIYFMPIVVYLNWRSLLII